MPVAHRLCDLGPIPGIAAERRQTLARGVNPWEATSNRTIPGGATERGNTPVPQSFTCLHFHLIFSTKNRAPMITEDLQSRLYEYFSGTLRGL